MGWAGKYDTLEFALLHVDHRECPVVAILVYGDEHHVLGEDVGLSAIVTTTGCVMLDRRVVVVSACLSGEPSEEVRVEEVAIETLCGNSICSKRCSTGGDANGLRRSDPPCASSEDQRSG